MKAFVVFAACVAAASANPQLLVNNLGLVGVNGAAVTYAAAPVVSHQIVAPLATKTQYHAQDELGQASYGYAHPGQAHAAVRDAAGNVRGSYAYINPNGKEVRVEYSAGHDGFRVASNDLPLAPIANTQVPVVANLVAPSQVQETPEVMQARAAHALAHQEALIRSGRRKRALVTSAVLPTSNIALGYSNVVSPYNTYAYGHTYTTPVLGNTVVSGYTTPVLGNTVVSGYNTPVLGNTVVSGYSTPVVSNVVSNVREATLTKIHNNPGHAVSYRVD